MKEVRDMVPYAERTKMDDSTFQRYSIQADEVKMFFELATDNHIYEAICLAYNLGMCRGFRGAKNASKPCSINSRGLSRRTEMIACATGRM